MLGFNAGISLRQTKSVRRERPMQYELTITLSLESNSNQDRVAKQFASLFDFGTVKESIVDGLQLLEDPRLVSISVRGKSRRAQH